MVQTASARYFFKGRVSEVEASSIQFIRIGSEQPVRKKYWSRDYSPNHRFKLIDQDRNNRSDLDMIDTRSGKRRTLAKREEAGFMNAWSPDSKFICVNWGLDDRPVVVNTHTGHRFYGETKQAVSDMLWSPDSRYVAMVGDATAREPYRFSMKVLDTITGRSREIPGIDQTAQLVAWTKDSRNLLVEKSIDGPNIQAIVLLPVPHGKGKVILTRKNIGSIVLSSYRNYMRDLGGE